MLEYLFKLDQLSACFGVFFVLNLTTEDIEGRNFLEHIHLKPIKNLRSLNSRKLKRQSLNVKP